MLPSLSRVTRFSGTGRSSVVSHQSTECLAASVRVHWGANMVSSGFSPRMASALDLPTIWMLPIGYS